MHRVSSAVSTKFGALAGLFVVATTAAVAMTCASNTPSGASDRDSGGGDRDEKQPAKQCAVRLEGPAPELEALATESPPRSELSIGLTVPTELMAAEIGKLVPRGLASAKRKPVGAAGEVTYNVTRGGFSFGLKNERLLVTTPVSVAVAICKPLGPICPTYGRCSPRLGVTVAVPLALGADYQLAKSVAFYNVQQGCSIAGMDQTSRIRKMADAQMASVNRRIQSAVPETRSLAQRLLAQVATARSIAGGGCMQIVPESVSQARPQLRAGSLTLRAVVGGTVLLSPTQCAPAEQPKLPKLSTLESGVSPPEQSDMAASVTIGWPTLSEALSASLGEAVLEDGSRITRLRVRAGSKGGQALVLVGATLTGPTCGETWLAAELAVDLSRGRLTLTGVRPWGEHGAVQGLAARLQQGAHAPLPATLIAAHASLADSLERVLAGGNKGLSLSKGVSVAVALELASPVATAVAHGPGAMVVIRRRGTVHASLVRN